MLHIYLETSKGMGAYFCLQRFNWAILKWKSGYINRYLQEQVQLYAHLYLLCKVNKSNHF